MRNLCIFLCFILAHNKEKEAVYHTIGKKNHTKDRESILGALGVLIGSTSVPTPLLRIPSILHIFLGNFFYQKIQS